MLLKLWSDHKTHFIRFCIVGAISTLINYSVFFALLNIFMTYFLIASSAGYLAGLAIGFFLNRSYTFKSANSARREIPRYITVYTTSLFLSIVLLWFGVEIIGLNTLIANFLIIGVTTITNYIGTKYLVFRDNPLNKIDYILFRYRYLINYIIIGISSILIEIVFILFLEKYFLYSSFYFKLIGFSIGLMFSYFLNSRLNFKVPKGNANKVFYLFASISLISYLLNLLLLRFISSVHFAGEYGVARLSTAAIIFLISYSLHRKFTFKDARQVGIAIYLNEGENVGAVYNKIGQFMDWIHLDLVDESFNPNTKPVALDNVEQVKRFWPHHKIMTHLMSKFPSRWISSVCRFSDYVVIHTNIEEDLLEALLNIKKNGKKTAICIASISELKGLSAETLINLDLVQIIGIEKPGKSGQSLNLNMINTLDEVNNFRKKLRLNFEVCFDGGIKLFNVNKINSKYIVSGSAVLNSSDPKKALFNLKTESRYYSIDNKFKELIKSSIYKIIDRHEYIVSGNLVGSFVDKESLEGISDIDIIIVLDKLSKEKFDEVISDFRLLGEKIGPDFGYEVLVNPAFGPLKFDSFRRVVFHVMIYDLESHRQHFINSPFTCLDWARTKHYRKKSLSDLWSLHVLSVPSFFDSRRGIRGYSSDLKKGVISYREYLFSKDGQVTEENKSFPMKEKEKFEFAYHIIRAVMLNSNKLVNKENILRSNKFLSDWYFKTFKKRNKEYLHFFTFLDDVKKRKAFEGKWDEKYATLLENFLEDAKQQIENFFYTGTKRIVLIRHQKTSKNVGGIFLGQLMNPPIEEIPSDSIEKIKKVLGKSEWKIYSSPSGRAVQSAMTIANKSPLLDKRLLEIDYGLAEGKTREYLAKFYPEIISSWANKKDPRFPLGENYADIAKRMDSFFKEKLSTLDNVAIVTHNVFLRVLLGRLFKIPMEHWYLIEIPHFEAIELIYKGGKFYPNLSEKQVEHMFKKLPLFNK